MVALLFRKLGLATPFLLLLLSVDLFAQPNQNSPYSRYGLGDPLPQYFTHHAGMGGLTTAYHDPHQLTVQNPASLAFLRTATFETGFYTNYSNYRSDDGKFNDWSGNLSYLALGFTLRSPINEALDKVQSPWRWGMGFSLAPYTLIGYNIFSNDTLPDLGAYTSAFEGDGGTSRFAWGTALRYKETSVGVNLGWVYGQAYQDNTTSITDSFPTFQTHLNTDYRINGFVWSLGVQHDHVLKYAENDEAQPARWITFGLTASSNHPLTIKADQFYLRSRGEFSEGIYLNPDTLLYTEGSRQSLKLPAMVSLGAMLVQLNKYRLGVQYDFGNWQAYENDLKPESLRNTHGVSIGAEYIRDNASYNRYLSRVRLRGGAYFRQDPRVVNGDQLNDFGGSIGFGFPIVLPRLQTSYLNTSLEVGHLGAGTPIQETYFRLTVGFCLNDNSWFYKRRFE